MPRLFAEYFNRGIARTYTYELADEGTNSSDREQDFGLMHYDLTPKPAYSAMKNLITLIKEPGANFIPGSLNYTLSGSTSGVDHLLMEKSDGTFYLLLWHEISVYSTTNGTDITNPDVSVTINFASAMDQVRLYRPNDSLNALATLTNQTSVNVSIPDYMEVVEIKPTIPEPVSIGVLAVGTLLLLRRPKRSRAGSFLPLSRSFR